MNAITIGLDIAKSILQVHGVDATGAVVVQRKLRRHQVEGFFRRHPPALVGMEACGSAHHRGRLLTRLGHEVRTMPPQYVKPYVKRNKTDARDAEAICEAVTRPTMRFVPIKTEAQQAGRGLHRVRDLLVRQRSALMQTIRGLTGEFGVSESKGARGGANLRAAIAADEIAVPELLHEGLAALARQWATLDDEIERLDRRIAAEAKADATARRLMAVPGIGPLVAHAIVRTHDRSRSRQIPLPDPLRKGDRPHIPPVTLPAATAGSPEHAAPSPRASPPPRSAPSSRPSPRAARAPARAGRRTRGAGAGA